MKFDFAHYVLNGELGDPITAYFKNGQVAEYTTSVWGLLVTDPDIECITSNETGEVLFYR